MCRERSLPPTPRISPFIIQLKPYMHKQGSNDLLRWGRSYQGKINLKAIYWSFSQPGNNKISQ